MNRRIAEDKVGISLRRPEHVARREAAISLPRPEAAIQTDAGLMVSDRDGPLQDGGLHCNAPCPPAVRKVFQLWAIKRNTPAQVRAPLNVNDPLRQISLALSAQSWTEARRRGSW
jgi:hypothetical protein